MKNQHILLSGAAGGIGQQLAIRLNEEGANLTLVDINETGLQQTGSLLKHTQYQSVSADLTTDEGRRSLLASAIGKFGPIDILINCAGINSFGVYAQQDSDTINKTIAVNLTAPMLLTHMALPSMQQRRHGHIVNIGSTFGSIGFAYFSAYSASKFGLRGFSQALRRELAGSGIDVTYIAPRAVRTALNSDAVYEMAPKVGMTFDEPKAVADSIIKAIKAKKREIYLGFPESFFVRINALLPGIVDRAVKKQNKVAQEYAALRNRVT